MDAEVKKLIRQTELGIITRADVEQYKPELLAAYDAAWAAKHPE